MGLKATDPLSEKSIRQCLRTEELGNEIHFYTTIDSTNARARTLAEAGGRHGTLVIAETQTGGQGRFGRVWESPPGGLWFSIILRPEAPGTSYHHLTFVAALAVALTAEREGITVSLRWLNDIDIGNKKAGGILVEATPEGERSHYCIVGMGLNINVLESDFPPELRGEATSFMMAKGKPLSRPHFLAGVLAEWEKLQKASQSLLRLDWKKGFIPILKGWKRYVHFLGTRVRVEKIRNGLVEGEAVDVTATGTLLVRISDGSLCEVESGEAVKVWYLPDR